jgi:renalase
MIDYCVLGAGLAGSTIANLLTKKYSVEVFDKARNPGGRTSNRRYKNTLSFDHGAQYFKPKLKEFDRFLKKLEKIKVVKKWIGNHIDLNLENDTLSNKYIGKNGNNDISKHLLKGVKTNYLSAIIKISFNSRHWTITINENKKINCKNLIITCPFPQLKKLAKNYLNKKTLSLPINMKPNITVMAAYKNHKKLSISSIKFEDKILGWAANENSKNRFKTNLNLWTVQTNLGYSKKFINKFKTNKKTVINTIIKRFNKLMGFKNSNLIFTNIHGWKYSYCYKRTPFKSLWSKKYNLGICGDWFIGPKAEHAWISASNLYSKIKHKKKPA